MKTTIALALQREISNALSYATSNGYQVHPDAFAMLKGLDTDILKVIQDIIKMKIKQKQNSLIVVDDIKIHINPENKDVINVTATATSTSSTASSFFEQNFHKVLLDSTANVNTGEGIEGYTTLFRSRFEKSLRILALRPESKRITKIASIKQKANTSKKGKSHHIEGNSITNSSIVAGLVMSKHSKKNGLEMIIDDYSGTLSALATTEELKKQASMITFDQMVMLEVESNMKGIQGFVIKNLVSPDIPDHLSNKSKSESYAVLISDLHVGSKYFMEAEFFRFLNWLSSTDDEIVSKIRYVCIGGDLIDGTGIFPNQDKELLEMNTTKQMMHVMDLLAKIPA